jgi:hypothetical protein|tara:strand:- start:356 stop:526 length:171 start_codon:yes stop_codon:yes gene_type:complete
MHLSGMLVKEARMPVIRSFQSGSLFQAGNQANASSSSWKIRKLISLLMDWYIRVMP